MGGVKKEALVITILFDLGPGDRRRVRSLRLDIVGIPHPEHVAFDGKSQLPFLAGVTDTHREWIYAYTGPVQVLRELSF